MFAGLVLNESGARQVNRLKQCKQYNVKEGSEGEGPITVRMNLASTTCLCNSENRCQELCESEQSA